MNKAFRETLSSVVVIKEQFARSTRIDDDDIDGATFATVGSLVEFVSSKLAA